ncbi:hypothetical protein [Sinorhizobium medicae]
MIIQKVRASLAPSIEAASCRAGGNIVEADFHQQRREGQVEDGVQDHQPGEGAEQTGLNERDVKTRNKGHWRQKGHDGAGNVDSRVQPP